MALIAIVVICIYYQMAQQLEMNTTRKERLVVDASHVPPLMGGDPTCDELGLRHAMSATGGRDMH